MYGLGLTEQTIKLKYSCSNKETFQGPVGTAEAKPIISNVQFISRRLLYSWSERFSAPSLPPLYSSTWCVVLGMIMSCGANTQTFVFQLEIIISMQFTICNLTYVLGFLKVDGDGGLTPVGTGPSAVSSP